MIYIDKNFLSKADCDKIIQFYLQNTDRVFQYRDTYPLNIEKISQVTDKIEKICMSLNSDVKLSLCQIVQWPKSSKMDWHYDEGDLFSAILYLNDDYRGGQTIFQNYTCDPKVGKLVIFSNSTIKHCVKEITSGTRYTLSFWFVRK
jgi:hypothetical protein